MSDYETTQRRRNIIVGIFVILAMFAFGVMVYKFGDLPVFVGQLKSYPVSVQFPSAPGVQENTPVRFCGYQIGRVTAVKPPKVMEDLKTGKIYHQTIVILSINKAYNRIPADVEVKLMTRGLGSSYIELKEQPYDVNEPAGEFLSAGSLLQGSTGISSEFFPEESQKKLDELVDSVRVLINNSNDIIGDPNNKENLKEILANLSEATGQATKAIEEFRRLSAAGTTVLKSADAGIEKLVTSMVGTSEELSETVKQLRQILVKIDEGRGTAARLINDGRLYENLLDNTEQIQAFLQELRSFIAEAREKGVKIKLK